MTGWERLSPDGQAVRCPRPSRSRWVSPNSGTPDTPFDQLVGRRGSRQTEPASAQEQRLELQVGAGRAFGYSSVGPPLLQLPTLCRTMLRDHCRMRVDVGKRKRIGVRMSLHNHTAEDLTVSAIGLKIRAGRRLQGALCERPSGW